MQLATRSDADLVRLAQQGAESAFAALVYRYAPPVRASVATHPDPVDAVIDTFRRAMRQLSDRDPEDPIAPWLLDLAARQVDDPAPIAIDDAPPMDPAELDQVWTALAPRWPNGRRPRYVPRWVWRTLAAIATLTVLLALAVLVPYVAITTAAEEREPTERVIDQVVAERYEEPVDRETASELYTPDGGSDGGPSLDFDIEDEVDTEESVDPDTDPSGDPDTTEDADTTADQTATTGGDATDATSGGSTGGTSGGTSDDGQGADGDRSSGADEVDDTAGGSGADDGGNGSADDGDADAGGTNGESGDGAGDTSGSDGSDGDGSDGDTDDGGDGSGTSGSDDGADGAGTSSSGSDETDGTDDGPTDDTDDGDGA